MRLLRPLLFALGLALAAGAAQAGTTVCRGPAPAVGETLRGPVLHVVDGDRLCVALDASPDSWVEVHVLDAPLRQASASARPRARGTLMAAAFARNAVCEIVGVGDGVPIAACAIEGRPLAERLGAPDVVRIGQAWR